MRIFIHLFLIQLFVSVNTISEAQILTPKWKSGDTLSYFITDSELVEQERISLDVLEIDIILKKLNKDRAILEGYLHLQAKDGQGRHWQQFYQRLEKVPFTFYLDFGSAHTFSRPVQVANSSASLKTALTELIATDYIQPLAYQEISNWLGQIDDVNVPPVLLSYFELLNPCFDKYGQPREGMGELQFANPISDCGDSVVSSLWNLSGNSNYPNPDTLVMYRSLSSDSSNTIFVYSAMAHCGKLEGLDDPEVLPDAYSFKQEEIWKATAADFNIFSYAYTKKIEMKFGELKTSRSWETRVLFQK